MSPKALQIFTDEYLEYSKKLTPEQVVQFLEDFRQVTGAGQPSKSKLSSIKIPENLLNSFKMQAKMEGRAYQTMIKDLMQAYLKSKSA